MGNEVGEKGETGREQETGGGIGSRMLKEMIVSLINLPDEARGRINACYLEGKKLGRDDLLNIKAQEEVSLILAEHWREEYLGRKGKQVQAGTEKEVLELHKKVDKNKDVEICSEVLIAPNGEVMIVVVPILGHKDSLFMALNHAVVRWLPEENKWVLEKYSYKDKLGEYDKVKKSRGVAGAGQAAFFMEPSEENQFANLGNAVFAARKFVEGVAVFATEELRKVPDPTGRLRGDQKKARKIFQAIPELTSLEPDQDKILKFAGEVAGSLELRSLINL